MALMDPAPTTAQRAYMLNGIIYLPHYLTKGLFVSPDGNTYKEAYLVDRCAPITLQLWPRGRNEAN